MRLFFKIPLALAVLALFRASPSGAIQSDSVVLRFGGDCLLAEHFERAMGEDIHRGFKNLELLRTADIAMVNLECPVTTRGNRIPKPFNFRMNPLFLQSLTEAGIDVVNIANNHIYDYDSTGLFDTIRYLDSVKLNHVGAGRDRDEAHRPVVLRAGGKRFGFLGYYGGGEAPPAGATQPGVARREIAAIASDIMSLRLRDSTDYIVVNLHWGVEKATIPERAQVEFAHQVIDAGADVIIGHHPHVLQGIERYRSGIVAYSLGNLLFGGNSRSSYTTALLEVRVLEDSLSYQLLPLRVDNWSVRSLGGIEGTELTRSVEQLSIPHVPYSKGDKSR